MYFEDQFKKYLLTEKNYSEVTYLNYTYDLKHLFEFTKKDVKEITKQDIKDFLEHLSERKIKMATRLRKLASFKRYFNFLVNADIIHFSPAASIEGGRIEKRLPKPVSEKDIDLVLNKVTDTRDRLIFEILYGTGARRFELLGMKFSDINFNEGTITVLGKGRKERIIPLNSYILNLISQLPYLNTSEYLITSKKDMVSPLSPRQLNSVVKKYSDYLGIKFTPHKFRHSFCTILFENGADYKVIQDLAGHSSANTTQLYTKVSVKRNKEEYLKHHPRA